MSDIDDAVIDLQVQLARAAANGGVSQYTQGDFSATLRDPLKDLDLLERLEARQARQNTNRSALSQGEVVDPA